MTERSSLAVYLGERNKLLMTRDLYPHFYPFSALASLAFLANYLIRGNWRVFSAGYRGWWAAIRRETGRPKVPI